MHARLLLAWEHGQNFGHLARLDAVAASLRTLKVHLSWAIPEGHLAVARESIALPGEAVRRTPSAGIGNTPSSSNPRSFADVLASFGFADEAALRLTVERWLEIFAQTSADGAILDYAPGAQLGALIAGLPAAHITNGFDAPPPGCPAFGIGVRGPMIDRKNAETLDRLNCVIDRVARDLGRSAGASVADMLAHPTRWYDCTAQADPYGPRSGIYLGPMGQPRNSVEAMWPSQKVGAKKVFVYLRDKAQVHAVLNVLNMLDAVVVCSWPEAPSAAVGTSGSQTVVDQAVSLTPLLQSCDAVVNYGSSTLVNQCILAGRPQLMLPTDAEKWLVASRVAACGFGVLVRWPVSPDELLSTMKRVLGSHEPNADSPRFHQWMSTTLDREAARFVEKIG